MDNLIEKCLLTDQELMDITTQRGSVVFSMIVDALRLQLEKAIPIIQQALLENLKQALKNSRDNKEIDLSEEWYELFNSIRNSGVQALLDEIEAELVESDSRNMWYLNKGFFDSLKENRDV